MAKIYGGVEGIENPEQTWDDAYEEAVEKYEGSLVKWCQENHPGKNSGEIVEFPYADGAARYVVMTMQPLQLIHIDTWDGWELPHVNRLTAKDIQQNLDFAAMLKNMRK